MQESRETRLSISPAQEQPYHTCRWQCKRLAERELCVTTKWKRKWRVKQHVRCTSRGETCIDARCSETFLQFRLQQVRITAKYFCAKSWEPPFIIRLLKNLLGCTPRDHCFLPLPQPLRFFFQSYLARWVHLSLHLS